MNGLNANVHCDEARVFLVLVYACSSVEPELRKQIRVLRIESVGRLLSSRSLLLELKDDGGICHG